MSNLLFGKPTDNIAANATITVGSGTGDAGYPPANLADLNPAKPAKLTTTTGRFVFEFPAPVTLEEFAIIHHNLTAGLANVKVEANSSNSWPGVVSVPITIPAYRSDGFPGNPHVDLTGTAAYKWWSLDFGTASGAPIQIGEVWMGTTRRLLTVNYRWNYEENDDQPLIEHTTDFQIRTVYSYGVSLRRFVAQLTTTDAGRLQLYDLWHSTNGRARPFLVALDADVNDCMLVRFNMAQMRSHRQFVDYNPIDLDLVEISRGLVL